MKIGFVVLSALAATCAANNTNNLSVGIPADSKLGNNILSKARLLEDEDESEDSGDGEDYSWVADYSIKFKSCHSINEFDAEGGGEDEGTTPARVQHLVSFNLCPNEFSCNSCKQGGEYVVELRDFVEQYIEIKKELIEAQCESVEENCNCDYYNGDDDDACLADCYSQAGLDDCIEDDFEVDKYMECEEAEFSNDAYYASTYYIGPVCAKGGSAVYLNLFKDASCSIAADSGAYETNMYGASLPYSKDSKQSIIDNECITCEAPAEEEEEDEDEDGDEGDGDERKLYYNEYYQQKEAIESCGEIYEKSGKCEKKMKGKEDQDILTCNYIHKVLPALEKVYKRGGLGSVTTFFMWVFLLTTLGACAGAYYFYTISERSNVNLNGNGGSRTNGRIT